MAKKKPTTSKKKLRRQARRMEPRSLMDKMLKEKPHLEGRLRANPPGDEKMSAVILEYAKPLMEHAENVEQQNKAIAMAIICWNASFVAENHGDGMVAEIAEAFEGTGGTEDASVREVIQFMLSRKEDLFSHYKKRVADWFVKDQGDQLVLEVATLTPKEDETP